MPSSISIRPLQLTDISAVYTLSQQLGYRVAFNTLQQQIIAILAHQDHHVFVAIQTDEIIGYIHGFKALRLTTEPFIELGALVVASEERRKGVGKMLVDHIEESALGCTNVRVRCNRMRAGAHQFYQKLSYLEAKEQKVFEKALSTRS